MILFLSTAMALPPLVGHWTFEPGAEVYDQTGNWDPLALYGTASVSGGALHTEGSGYTPLGWAIGNNYYGPSFREKTLIALVSLRDNGAIAGSALTIDKLSTDAYDGLVWNELSANGWMNGSSGLVRSFSLGPGAATVPPTGEMVIGISYRDTPTGSEIHACIHGNDIAPYETVAIETYDPGDAEVVFGARHYYPGYLPAGLNADIHEARIYAGVMDCAEIADAFCDDADLDGVCDAVDVCDGDDASGDGDADGVCDDTDFLLSVPTLTRGAVVTFATARGEPGAPVTFLASTRGPGPGPCHPTAGVCADVRGPVRVLGQGIADGAGNASVTVRIPNTLAAGTNVAFQAVSLGGVADTTQVAVGVVL